MEPVRAGQRLTMLYYTKHYYVVFLLFFCVSLFADKTASLEKLSDLELKSDNAEILSYSEPADVLTVTSSFSKRICFFRIDFKTGAISKLGAGLGLSAEPTSVAAHPRLPVCFAVTLAESMKTQGRLLALDLRKESLGKKLIDMEICTWPDSIAVSPDGRFLIVADESEDATENGAVVVADITGFDPTKPDPSGIKITRLEGLDSFIEALPRDIEPEYVAVDPQSRFAAVTCQENDAVLIIDLTSDKPAIVNSIVLPRCFEPDGVSIIDNVRLMDRMGCVLATANEGRKDDKGVRRGQSVSFYFIWPADLKRRPVHITTLPISNFVDVPGSKRYDPEGICLARNNERVFAFITIERKDRLVCLDITEPAKPLHIGTIRTGSRPEGVTAINKNGALYVLTGNEADEEPGSITHARVR